MGAEILLLFGLGVMGVVLSNLLAGEGADTLTADRPRTGAPAAVTAAPEAPTGEGTEPGTAVGTIDGAPADAADGVDADADAETDWAPSIWGHPAPLARLLALVAVGALALASTLWLAGWLAARAIGGVVAGG